jgi:nicotinic acid mononucleotide adenylyltransferase
LTFQKISQKSKNNLKNVPPHTEIVVLVLSGALSPIHLMHVDCLERSRQYLETFEKVPVVGGFICPSSDSYVSYKLGMERILLDKRCHLTDLALASSSWISTNSWGWANAHGIVHQTQYMLNMEFPEYKINVYLVAGADHVFKHRLFTGEQEKIFCIGRTEDTDKVKQALNNSVYPNRNLILLDGGEEDISSTRVRKFILEENWDALTQFLHPDVLSAIRARGKNIFAQKI